MGPLAALAKALRRGLAGPVEVLRAESGARGTPAHRAIARWLAGLRLQEDRRRWTPADGDGRWDPGARPLVETAAWLRARRRQVAFGAVAARRPGYRDAGAG